MNSVNFIDDYLKKTLSCHRYEHSVSTARTCRKLAEKFCYDPDKAYFAGLVHDIAREYSDDKLLEISARDGMKITDEEKKYPCLLHGRCGAVVLKEMFKIDDEQILHAIQVHTTGAHGMNTLDKILFAADYIEPERRHITSEFLQHLEGKSLDQIVYIVLKSTVDYLVSKGKEVAGPVQELLEEFSGNV